MQTCIHHGITRAAGSINANLAIKTVYLKVKSQPHLQLQLYSYIETGQHPGHAWEAPSMAQQIFKHALQLTSFAAKILVTTQSHNQDFENQLYSYTFPRARALPSMTYSHSFIAIYSYPCQACLSSSAWVVQCDMHICMRAWIVLIATMHVMIIH